MAVKLLLIAVGGAAGSVLRFLLSTWLQPDRPAGTSAFPVGTLAVNALGSLAVGVLAAAFFSSAQPAREESRLLLIAGLLGGFTTFSAFSSETFELIRHGHLGRAALNVVATNALCLFAVWIGYWGAQRF